MTFWLKIRTRHAELHPSLAKLFTLLFVICIPAVVFDFTYLYTVAEPLTAKGTIAPKTSELDDVDPLIRSRSDLLKLENILGENGIGDSRVERFITELSPLREYDSSATLSLSPSMRAQLQVQRVKFFTLIYLATRESEYLDSAKHAWGYFERVRNPNSSIEDLGTDEIGAEIQAACALYSANKDEALLEKGLKSADWVETHRTLPTGGYRPFLKNASEESASLHATISMFAAHLALLRVTGDRRWLDRALPSGDLLVNLLSAGKTKERANDHLAQFELIDAARSLNLLSQYLSLSSIPHPREGDADRFKTLAKKLITEASKNERSIKLALTVTERELATHPLHIVVVGARDDKRSHELFAEALSQPTYYKQLEWIDPTSTAGDLPYPPLAKPAAYICTEKRCSLPLHTTQEIAPTITAMRKAELN